MIDEKLGHAGTRWRCIRYLSIVSVICVMFAWSVQARADTSGAEQELQEEPRSAQDYADQGARFMQSRQYAQAIEAYGSAYEEKQRPIYLLRIAQAYRRQGSYRLALETYQRYLKEDPITPFLVETKDAITEVEDLMKPKPPVSLSRRLHKQWWFWTALGVAVTGAVVAGAVVGTRPPAPIQLPVENAR